MVKAQFLLIAQCYATQMQPLAQNNDKQILFSFQALGSGKLRSKPNSLPFKIHQTYKMYSANRRAAF